MLRWLLGKTDKQKEEQEVQKEYSFSDLEAKEILIEIKSNYGLDYSKQEFITMKKLERFAKLHNLFSFKELQEEIKKEHTLYEKLINMLTVGETYFYRELGQIEHLAEVLEHKKNLNILSAPCSSGEEVYSILLYLQSKKLLSNAVKIKGIDINSDALCKAREGVYSERSTSQLPHEIRQQYFTKKANEYKLDEHFKQYVEFHRANVFELREGTDKYDIILSRNMLIYFDEEKKKKVIEKFRTLLKEDGLLCLGHADISFIPDGFTKENARSNIYKLL